MQTHLATKQQMAIKAIEAEIAKRRFSPQQRLPSIRSLSKKLSLSNSTIVEAYDKLVASGDVLAKPGSGFFVADKTTPLSISEAPPQQHMDVDPVWMGRQSLLSAKQDAAPGCGWLPHSWMPEQEIAKAMRTLLRNNQTNLTNYASPQGMPELRQLIARRQADLNIDISPQQVILTDSGTQALDLVCRFLLKPGDKVLIDDPCYFNFRAMLRAHHVEAVSVPLTTKGADLDAFEEALSEHRPRLYITNSVLQNPTGVSISNVHAHKLLNLAEKHDLIILEDDIFADLQEKPSTRLAAFDGLDRVIQIGSFSKTLSASIRCGFIIAKPGWVDEMTNLRLATSYGGSSFNTQLIFKLLTEGSYRRHVNAVRDRLSKQRSYVLRNLDALDIQPWHTPSEGIFVWCRLPNERDAEQVARTAIQDGLMLAPGNAFSHKQTAANFMRFNIAQMNDPAIFQKLKKAIAHA